MKNIILVLVIAGAAAFGLLNYHFILFDDDFRILRKTGVRYENTFVDARGTKKFELVLKSDLIGAGLQDMMNHMEKAADGPGHSQKAQ